MSYNRCLGMYKFGNNTYPWRIRRRSNLGNIFREKKWTLCAGKYGTYKPQDTKYLSVSTDNAWLPHSITDLMWTYLTCLPWQGGIYDVCGTNVGLWGGEMFSGSAPTGWGNMHWYVTKVVSKLWRPCWSWFPSCKACNKNQASS